LWQLCANCKKKKGKKGDRKEGGLRNVSKQEDFVGRGEDWAAAMMVKKKT